MLRERCNRPQPGVLSAKSKAPAQARASVEVAKSLWPTGHPLFGLQAISRHGLDAFDFLGDGDCHLFL